MGTREESNQPLALAFAVAALQGGVSPQDMVVPNVTSAANTIRSAEPPVAADSNHGLGHLVSLETQNTLTTDTQAAGSGSQEQQHDADGSPKNDHSSPVDAERLAKCRERNREHARKTRLRKKAHMELLQSKVKGLEAERQVLRQRLEECSTATILLGFANSSSKSSSDNGTNKSPTALTQQLLESFMANNSNSSAKVDDQAVARLTNHRRKRFVPVTTTTDKNDKDKSPPQSLTLCLDGQTTLTVVSGGCHINWKTGVYNDQVTGTQKQLTPHQLQTLRRERNRMHAKLTRDRKKCFIKSMEQMITDLQAECDQMRGVLEQFVRAQAVVTPITSPELGAVNSSRLVVGGGDDTPAAAPSNTAKRGDPTEGRDDNDNDERPSKRARQSVAISPVGHGFSLDKS